MSILATLEQLAESRGVPEDPTDLQAQRALEDASAMFRSLAHQTISFVENDEVELEGRWGRRLYLPERPVLAVSAVTIETEAATDPADWSNTEWATPMYRWARRGLLKLRWDCYWGGDDATVKVTYSHGYAVIPEDVVAVVCSIAERVRRNPTHAIAERMGEHDVTWATTRVDGTAVGLTAEEQRVIERYQPMR